MMVDFCRRMLTDKSEPRDVVQIITEEDWDEITSVELGYKDISVSPEYQCGYSMVFTQVKLRVEAFSHGKIVPSFMKVLPHGKFEELKCLLSKQRIRKVEEYSSGMIGGVSGYISLMKDEEMFFSACIYGNYKTTEGNLSFDGFLFDAVYSVFPWLEDFVNESIGNFRR